MTIILLQTICFFIGNIRLHIGRSYHLGCPVGFGNKWIANKWVKWTGQVIHGTLTIGERLSTVDLLKGNVDSTGLDG